MAKHLVIVAGATASGKTALGIRLARHFQTVIISADSRQFFRELNIGTAKPTPTELAAAPHFLVNSLSIFEPYSVGQFERDALQLLDNLFQQHEVVLMVGGSGLYIQAICQGLDDFPEIPPSIRENLTQLFDIQGITALQEALKIADPAYYKVVDLNNPHRLIRALEVSEATGQPFSSFQNRKKINRDFQPILVVLDWERATLYDRINDRVDTMLAAGLLEEARAFYPYKHLNALQTVGYQEFFDYFDGVISLDEAVRLVKRNSRRYAKRQLTWFRNQGNAHFFHPDNWDDLIHFLEKTITSNPSVS